MKYQERDATKSTLDPEDVRLFVTSRRVTEMANMETRAGQIARGLKHETVAAQRDRGRYRHER